MWGFHLNICDAFYSLYKNNSVPKPRELSTCIKIMTSIKVLFSFTRTHGSAPVLSSDILPGDVIGKSSTNGALLLGFHTEV